MDWKSGQSVFIPYPLPFSHRPIFEAQPTISWKTEKVESLKKGFSIFVKHIIPLPVSFRRKPRWAKNDFLVELLSRWKQWDLEKKSTLRFVPSLSLFLYNQFLWCLFFKWLSIKSWVTAEIFLARVFKVEILFLAECFVSLKKNNLVPNFFSSYFLKIRIFVV